MADLLKAPCEWCGYNGKMYWDSGSHQRDCPWRDVCGEGDRLRMLRALAGVTEKIDLSGNTKYLRMPTLDSPLFLACKKIRAERGKQYNQGGIELVDYFPFGHISYAQMVHMKATRLRAEIRGRSNPVFSLLEEHIVDLTNYLCFWYEEAIRQNEKKSQS